MAADKVQICNLALASVGVTQFIANLDTERSNEAITCGLVYDLALDFALRDYDWAFARRTVALALVGGDVAPNWTYKYAYPNDCLAARALVTAGARFPRSDQRIPFDVGNDGAGRVIYTDQAGAVLRYTTRVDNPALYDPQFVRAFAYLLGSELAVPLALKPDVAKSARDGYVFTASRAVANDLRERETGPEPDPVIIGVRNG